MSAEPKKKGDTFTLESEVLNSARTYLESQSQEQGELYTAYAALVDEYNKLLDEAKFITKVSDKLESKLNTANEKLQSFNETLTNEADTAKAEKERAQQRSKELNKQREQIAKQASKQQMMIVIFVAVYAISMGLTLWILYFRQDAQQRVANSDNWTNTIKRFEGRSDAEVKIDNIFLRQSDGSFYPTPPTDTTRTTPGSAAVPAQRQQATPPPAQQPAPAGNTEAQPTQGDPNSGGF
jgi:uncharacterized membrane protein